MKKLILCIMLAAPMFSCVSKKSADKLQSENRELAEALAQKDSMINDVFASLSDIAENLNAIKSRENIISSSVGTGEVRKHVAVQIGEDMGEIDKLLQNNRETIARLEKNVAALRDANVKIASLDKLVKELSAQVEQKDGEINDLKVRLENMGAEVSELTGRVRDLSSDNTSLQRELVAQTDMLNAVYYIVGSQQELIRSGIVYKSGFIGRTLNINENRSLDDLTQVDARDFREVMIGHKKAELVSDHPAGSYEFVADRDGVFNSLVITDKDKFWELSKVLVISYK